MKSPTKVGGRFLKLDILKMSKNENLEGNVCKNINLLGDALNTKKIVQNLLA